MLSLIRRALIAAVLATTAGTLPLAAARAAAADPRLVTVTSAPERKAGEPATLVATATENGVAVPDGTPVTFKVIGVSGRHNDGIITGPAVVGMAVHADGDGYWVVDESGAVLPYGNAPFAGDFATAGLDGTVVGIAASPSGNGYWLATADGRVVPFGDAGPGADFGAVLGAEQLVGIQPVPDGGYRVASDGGRVLPRVAPAFYGDMAGVSLATPVTGFTNTASGKGYHLFNGTSEMYNFGDAKFMGNMAGRPLASPIVAIVPWGNSDSGYLMVNAMGAIYNFSVFPFAGSLGDRLPTWPIVTAVHAPAGGYWMLGSDGTVYNFGSAGHFGDAYTVPANAGRAEFTFTSLDEGTTSVVVSVPGSAGTTVRQTWLRNPELLAAESGYFMLGADGAVYAFGAAAKVGDATTALRSAAVDLEPDPAGGGYWIVEELGQVTSYGSGVVNLGGLPAGTLAAGERVSSLSATPSGNGYWIFTDRGRVFPFGDAGHFGDMAGRPLNGPVLDSIPAPDGAGYYMVASDGGIFAFGSAQFAGSMGGRRLNAPVQSLVPDPDGGGYWLVASDGGVFAFDAPFRGSMGGRPLNRPVTGMVPFGDGYLMVAEDGGIFAFSDLPFLGSLGGRPPARPIVSVAAIGR